MTKQYYKILLYSLYLGALICVIYLTFTYVQKKNDKERFAPNYYDSIVVNQNVTYSSMVEDVEPYEIPFLRVRNIGFKTEQDYMYFKFQLAGTLPIDESEMPTLYGDKITSAYYKLALDENYFDFQGNKNPSSPEAVLLINFYLADKTEIGNKIKVDGELIKGGPGFDYFIVRYPYSQLLINNNSPFIVFSAESYLTSQRYPEGITNNIFQNSLLSASGDDSEIVLDRTLQHLRY